MFSSRLTALRVKAGMSQDDIAKHLGIARATYTKLESGQKSPTLEQLLALCNLFQVAIEYFIDKEGMSDNIALRVVQFKSDTSKIVEPREAVVDKVDSLREVLLYVLNKIGAKPNIGQTALYKLLYFIDFDYYEKRGESITGLSYIKNQFGPTPMRTFKDVVGQMKKDQELKELRVQYFGMGQVRYLPVVNPSFNHLSADEVKHIDGVLERLSDKSAKELSTLSHSDMPWLATKDKEIIDYQLAMYRTAGMSTEVPQDGL